MALKAKPISPIPAAELKALQERLQAPFQSTLWESEATTLLVAAVPHDEPDIINDLEQVVEHADPAEVEVATGCLLVGRRAMHNVPVTPVKALMADRVNFDRRQEETLRAQLPATLAHTIYKAPSDPRRRLRLAIRVPEEHVAQLSDEDMDTLVDRLGPLLDKGRLDRLHCVHVVASKDAVRIEATPFLEDLRSRWDEVGRARLEARQEAARGPPAQTEAVGEQVGSAKAIHAEEPVALDPRFERSDEELEAMRSAIDSLENGRRVEEIVDDVVAPRPTGSPTLDRLRSTLQAAGFEVRVRPEAGEHVVDLAAERPEGDVQRVIAVEVDEFALEDAEALLRAARDLDVDVAIALCRETDRDARRRVVATQVRIVRRQELPDLRL